MAPQTLEQRISKNDTTKKLAADTGWGLYASKDIPARETIISILRPLVVSLDIPRLKDTCYNCLGYDADVFERYRNGAAGEDDKKLQICSGCHAVRYCSRVC
jgi:MYND finger